MKTILTAIVLLAGLVTAQTPLPPGHPSVANEQPAANPADVATIDAILNAYYRTLSGPAGQPRDWDRLRSLFLQGARYVTARGHGPTSTMLAISPDRFIELNSRYFERGGYFESEAHRHVDEFGRMAHVFSTYEARRASAEVKPYLRGINSFQLLRAGGRWWIASVMWDHEQPDGPRIPPTYLPSGAADGGARP